ncbi:MAG: radical SAM protein, partial [Bacillota bacterium]
MDTLKDKFHYASRSIGLVKNLLTGGYIHCNIQLTHRCNFKCQICDFWKAEHQKEKELSLSEVEVISKKLSRFGTLAVSLAGGEPMLREDLESIIGVIARHHFPIMITNGWFIDNKNAERLWSAGLQEISVSVDYSSKEKHDAMRNKQGAFDNAVKALKILNEKRPSKKNRVHMISVLMEDNIDEVEDMIRLAKELGVTYMVNLYSFQRGRKSERLPKREVSEQLLSLKK